VKRDASRAKALADLDRVAGTSLTSLDEAALPMPPFQP
jgi:hypothetical protein